MSVPFSNTHLRVPRGFGTMLEGLVREVLRDQPEDIPKYAAQYFEALLKQREEGGIDPAEWAAKMEDRFYNNHAFKTTGASSENQSPTDMTISKEISYASQTEDESSHSAEASNYFTIQPNVLEEVYLTESTEEEEEEEEEEEKHHVTEEDITSVEKGLPEEESSNRLPVADVQSDDKKEPTITKFDKVDAESNDKHQDIHQSELESGDKLSFSRVSNVDVCTQELEMTEDEGGNNQEIAAVDKEVLDSEGEENVDAKEPVGVFAYSGLADVDVCATELGGMEVKMEGFSGENDTHILEERSSKPQPGGNLVESSVSQCETPEGDDQEADDQEVKTKLAGTEPEASSEETHEGLAHIEGGLDSNATPEDDSSVEISFEDEVTALATGQKISVTQDHGESEMEGVEKEVNSEGEEMESQHEASEIMKEMMDTNDSNLNNSDDDDEKGEGVENISSSFQPTIEADEEEREDETDRKNDDNKNMHEGKFQQNKDSENENKSSDPDFKEDDTASTAGGDEEGIPTEGYSKKEDEETNDGDAANHLSQVTQSNISTTAMETENEPFEASAQHLPEENKESQRSLVESHPDDTADEKEVTLKEAEELVEEGTTDSEIQEKSEEDSINC